MSSIGFFYKIWPLPAFALLVSAKDKKEDNLLKLVTLWGHDPIL
jgi:hypothetical protein